MIPHGVLRQLALAGKISGGGFTRRARGAVCPKCRAGVIRGLDADVCAFDSEADPVQLTPAGQAAALADGRTLFELNLYGRIELNRLDGRAPLDGRPVLAEHVCGSRIPAPWRADSNRPPRNT